MRPCTEVKFYVKGPTLSDKQVTVSLTQPHQPTGRQIFFQLSSSRERLGAEGSVTNELRKPSGRFDRLPILICPHSLRSIDGAHRPAVGQLPRHLFASLNTPGQRGNVLVLQLRDQFVGRMLVEQFHLRFTHPALVLRRTTPTERRPSQQLP